MATNARTRVALSNQTNLVRDAYHKSASQVALSHPTEPRYVAEYGTEILGYFLEVERVLYGERLYMDRQSEVTDRMRKILVDWLMDVTAEFKLHPETFFLAVDIIDRFLFFYSIPRTKLQLVGVTAILIAAKHEEVWPPTVNDCVAVTANTYSAREVIDMEFDIVTALRFKFTVPTTYPIACRLLDVPRVSQQVRHAAFMFLESAAHCYPLLQFLPSRIAAASVMLATLLVRSSIATESSPVSQMWESEFQSASHGIKFEELVVIAEQLLPFTQRLCSSSSRLQALRRKYSSREYSSVGALQFPPVSLIA